MRKTKSSTEFDSVFQPGHRPLVHQQSRRRWPHPVNLLASVPKELLSRSEPLTGYGAQRLSKLLGSAGIVLWEADGETFEFTYVSEEAARLVGYESEQWYQPDFFAAHVHRDDCERVLALRRNYSQQDQASDFEFRMLAKDQHIVWFRILTDAGERNEDCGRVRGLMIDITDRKLAEESLRELSGRLISAQEEERSRVARELHDDVNQRIAVLSIQLEQIQQDLQKSLDLSGRFQNLQALAQEISNDVQRLSYRLHPSKLDHLGLGPAVKSLCAELKQSRRLQIQFREARVPACIPQDVTLCVFRIAQEALRNCIKHSGARAVEVLLERTNNEIHLSVSDNGCGFHPESALAKKGLGFISMRERLRLVDGCMQIHSKPLRGTRVEVSVPLTGEVEATTSTDCYREEATVVTRPQQKLIAVRS